MPCRVGITTEPDRRREEWEDQVIGFRNWEILEQFDNRADAQTYEDEYASEHSCEAHPGGDDALGTWYVYCFEYDRAH